MKRVLVFINNTFLFVLILLIALTFHPRFVDLTNEAGGGQGGVLYPYIITCFISLFVLCLRKIRVYDFIRHFSPLLIPFVFTVFVSVLILAVFNDMSMLLGDVRPIAISLIALFIGYYADLSDSSLRFLVLVFALAALWVGVEQVFVRGGGFVIEGYFADNKNQLGPLLMTAAVSSFAMIRKRELIDVCFIALSIGCVVTALTIRARAAVLSGAVSFVVLLLMMNKKRGTFGSIIVTFLIVGLGFVLLPETAKGYVYDSFFGGYTSGDVTSGRIERNEAVVSFLGENFWTGRLGLSNANLAIAHNYVLNILYKYGFLFSIPLLWLYFVLFSQCLKSPSGKYGFDFKFIGIVTFYIPFIVSLFEYTFPYGPGTATSFNFLLLGISLKNINSNSNKLLVDSNIE